MGAEATEELEAGGRSAPDGAGTAPVPGAASAWALLGVILLFAFATVRLGAQGIATVRGGLESVEWVVLVALTGAFVYAEGYRALQRRYAPFVVRRARALSRERSPWLRLLAPLYAMSLVGAPARNVLRAWAGVLAIVLAVAVVRALPEPWRGIVDLAVAAALAWGTVAVLARGIRSIPGDRSGPAAEGR